MTCVKSPWRFYNLPSTKMLWGLYTVSYAIANLVESHCETSGADCALPKFVATTAFYVPFSILQDRAYVRMFGAGAPRSLPKITWALFVFRDASNLLMSFCLPQKVADWTASGSATAHAQRRREAQFGLPILTQVYANALHVIGLDYYSRPSIQKFASRLPEIRAQYPGALALRQCRLGVALSVGGVGNTALRHSLREMLLKPNCQLSVSGFGHLRVMLPEVRMSQCNVEPGSVFVPIRDLAN